MITVDAINFDGKKALIRVDFNVPLDENGNITDTTRIEAAKPTILKILEDGGAAILMSHLGRPKAQEAEFSLSHICSKLTEIIGVEVNFVNDCVGPVAEEAAGDLEMGKILLLENLRFHKEETAGDPAFAKALSKLGDIYVNDAFGTAHRAHASTTIIAQYFPEHKCVGKLLAKEIESLDLVLNNSKKPVLAILGGAKVSSKITVIENILDKVDEMIIGGGMAYTFIKAQGGKIGDSICEDDKMELALNILAGATIALGKSIANATKNGAFSLVGGGDSVAAVKQFGFDTKVSYVSTGGGAMLEMLEGKTLPGIAAILA